MPIILFIEDEAVLQKAVGDFLTQEGYSVKKALDGESGLQTARAIKPDLVLLDLILPKMQGTDVLQRLKEDKATQDIPVIIFTNSEDLQSIEKSILGGVFAYLIKTKYSLQDLLQKIKQALNQN